MSALSNILKFLSAKKKQLLVFLISLLMVIEMGMGLAGKESPFIGKALQFLQGVEEKMPEDKPEVLPAPKQSHLRIRTVKTTCKHLSNYLPA